MSPSAGSVAGWPYLRRPVKAVCKALQVERLDADLLALTEIDRDTGTIWFLYHKPLTTREELPGELHRLQSLGWIEPTPEDRWAITGAGREALSAARNWGFQVDEISREKEGGQKAVVVGRLVTGSMSFFASPYFCHFTITRDGAAMGSGRVDDVRPTADPEDPCVVVSLELWEGERLEHGDLLRFREVWVG